jgi:transposase
MFGISLGTVKRLLQQRQRTGTLAPKARPGRQPTIAPALPIARAAQLAAHDDATLEQHTELWNARHGMTLSRSTVGRAIKRLGWMRTKRRWVLASVTSSSEQRSGSGLSRSTRTLS